MKPLTWIAFLLVIIGALNWGSIAFFGVNFVGKIFGATVVTRAIFALVGISGIYLLFARPIK